MARSRVEQERLRILEKIVDPTWPDDPAAYLRGAGWEYLPQAERSTPEKCWRDHAAARREVPAEVNFPGKEYRKGMFETTSQKVVPALPWDYTTQDAVALQRAREIELTRQDLGIPGSGSDQE